MIPLRRRSNGPKPPGARVKLRLAWGDAPPCPATLRLPSGRRYLVIGVSGRTIHCIVVSPTDTDVPPVLDWRWAPRGSRKASR